MRVVRKAKAVVLTLALGSQAACLDLAPSPFQEIGPLLSAYLRAQTKTYIAVGASGTVLRSTDGVTWTAQTFPNTLLVNAVTWTGQRFVAVGQGTTAPVGNARAYHSTDGRTWTELVTPCASGAQAGNLTAVTTNGTRVVAVGATGASAPCAVFSDDHGLTWASASVPGGGGDFQGAAFANSNFITQGPSLTPHRSPTGATFTANGGTPLNAVGTFSTLAYLPTLDRLIVTGTGNGKAVQAAHSSDGGATFGANQDIFGGNGSNQYVRAMAASSTRVVAVGDVNITQCRLDFTENFTTFAWQSPEIFMGGCTSTQFNGIIHDGTRFIAVGASGRMATSATGSANDWTITTPGGAANLNGIAIGIQ